MKQTLTLKTTQQLSMTPQLQQAIRLLQLSSLELLDEIHEQLESNPLLELEQPGDEQDSPDEPSSVELWQSAGSGRQYGDLPDDFDREETTDLKDHLLWQLQLQRLTSMDQAIGYCLIDGIDRKGYLQASFADIKTAVQTLLKCRDAEVPDDDEITAMLHRLQQFEPAGVGARNLIECLSIQLQLLPDNTPGKTQAQALLNQLEQCDNPYKTLLAKARDPQALALLRQLHPSPGNTYDDADTPYLIPDVIVYKHRGKWAVRLNPQLEPKLSLNQTYTGLIDSVENENDGNYLRQQLQQAKWFIKSIENRKSTLLEVSALLLKTQQHFFDFGVEAMKPLTLLDIAEQLGMHESTISRVTTQKYMHTPHGIFELKYFFSSHIETEGGGECSSTAIRAIIKRLVNSEDPERPLSDNSLTRLLNDQGIKVARRTVAKYREELNIAPSNERKRLR